MSRHVTIYVPLADEGVDAWRPVAASPMDDGSFTIMEQPYDTSDERWAFEPGQRVVCRRTELEGEQVLVATELA